MGTMTASPIRSILAGLACTLAMSSLGYSQEMIDPAGITATAGSQYASGEFTPSDLLDGMILEGWRNLGTDGPPARPANHQNQHWLSADGIFTETVTFDLGGAYDLTSLMVLNTSNTNWNDSETDTFTIATSTDGGGSYSPPGTEIALQDYTLGFQAVPLVSSGVTHVKLVVTNSQVVDGDANGENLPANEARVGLNEV